MALEEFRAHLSQMEVGKVQIKTNGEHIAANKIGQAIVKGLGLTWKQVVAELDKYEGLLGSL
jgi:UDP-N-acetylmuramate-alanine ligase